MDRGKSSRNCKFGNHCTTCRRCSDVRRIRALSLGAAIPDLQAFARVSVILAGSGAAAAGADVVLKVQ